MDTRYVLIGGPAPRNTKYFRVTTEIWSHPYDSHYVEKYGRLSEMTVEVGKNAFLSP